MWTIFKVFFLLGWVSFGGPAAHIGYFRQTFVEKLKWLSEQEYAQFVALSQFLPGPGSSQVGFAIGYKQGGLIGAIAAFIGFTAPSVLIMLGLATLSHQFLEHSMFDSIIQGLKLLAVVVVADAALGMYNNFCKSKMTVTLCFLTAIALLLFPNIYTQFIILIGAASLGAVYLKGTAVAESTRFKPSYLPLIVFLLLLVIVPFVAYLSPELALFNDFYQAGSLVFGGGHVVLPLLQNIVGDQLSQDTFITGYAAAQAVPGPMFTFATFIGYELFDGSPILGAIIATIAVFLPGFLLLLTVLKNWQSLANKSYIAGALSGVNAAVVGLLIAALYQPVFTSAVSSSQDMAMIVFGIYLHKHLRLHIVWLVVSFVLLSVGLNYL